MLLRLTNRSSLLLEVKVVDRLDRLHFSEGLLSDCEPVSFSDEVLAADPAEVRDAIGATFRTDVSVFL